MRLPHASHKYVLAPTSQLTTQYLGIVQSEFGRRETQGRLPPLLHVHPVSTESTMHSVIGEFTLHSATQAHDNNDGGTQNMRADHLVVDR